MAVYNRTGLSDEIATLQNALIVPPKSQGDPLGVLNSDGEFCEFSKEYLRPRRAAPPAEAVEPAVELEGNYLYGGWMHPHFGHFLAESTARLWALDELADKIDAILYIPIRRGTIWRTRKSYWPFFDILTGGIEIRPVTQISRVQTLHVPDPGFGHEDRMQGSPRYRAYTRSAIAKNVDAKGRGKLYISRSLLASHKGGIFGETYLEEIMAADGYEVFHPQKHDVATQLAKYRAATHIVALDGSALHMVAYALNETAKVAMIYRRRGGVLSRLAAQLRGFSSAEVLEIDAIKDIWVKKGSTRIDYSSVGELDFSVVADALFESGFLSKRPDTRNLTEAQITKILSDEERPEMEPYNAVTD